MKIRYKPTSVLGEVALLSKCNHVIIIFYLQVIDNIFCCYPFANPRLNNKYE